MMNAVGAGCAAGTVMGARNGSLSTAAAGCGFFGLGQLLVQLGLTNEAPLKPIPSAMPQVPPREPANIKNGGALDDTALPVRQAKFFS